MVQEDVVIKIRTELVEGKYNLNRIQKDYKKGLMSFESMAKAEQAMYDKTLQLKKSLGTTPFAGWAMSIMFAGMALQRMSSQLYTFGTKAFNEISHSVEGTVTQTDMLEGSMKYLGYTFGEALQPVAELLIPIIDYISELLESSPLLQGFVRTFVILAAIFGTLAAVGGASALAYNGLKDTIVILAKAYQTLTTFITTATIAQTKFTIASALSLTGIIVGIGAVLYWIYKLQESMGGLEQFFLSVLRGIIRGLAFLADFLITTVISPIQTLLSLLAKGMNAVGLKTPSWLKDVINWKPSIAESYLNWEQSSALAPSQGYMEYGGLLPKASTTYNINIEKVETTNAESLMNEIKRYQNMSAQ